jgi:hypothetical protein
VNKIIYVEKLDNTYLRLTSNSDEVIKQVSKYFSFFAENYKYMPKFQQHIWDGKISLFNGYNNTLPIGLWKHLFDFCESKNIIVNPLNLNTQDLIDTSIEYAVAKINNK